MPTRYKPIDDGKPLDALSISARAVEEAGHAVMSAYLRVNFSKVQINNNETPGGIGGSIDSVFNVTRGIRDRNYVRRQALTVMAGAAAQRLFFDRNAKENPSDLSVVEQCYRLVEDPSPPSLRELRREADSIFARDNLRAAIKLVAWILSQEGTITPKEVRQIIKSSRPVRQETQKK